MCGIAGLVDPALAPDVRAEAVTRMCAAMIHRGPDDVGQASFATATLGMRRLAIFDPANGRQPMRTTDGRFTIVFNGAIYNFRALREELGAGGASFRTDCDTEVLLAAYARWGEACLPRLRGMFAFAVWDAHTHTLFLARDPFGIKPLYYRHDGPRLSFASELNALRLAGGPGAEIDPLSVADYLAWFSVPAPRTIYRGIFSLRPGECATFAGGKLTPRLAWRFPAAAPAPGAGASRAEFLRGLRAQLEDTIRAHVIADVPVGAFLSGGLDSAAVVGLMTRVTGSRLRTFSIDFAEAGYSEAGPAQEVAAHYGTEHHTTVLTGQTLVRDLEKLLAAFDQPTGDGINTYYASEAARRGGVTVALSGLGGDELFGGYPSFRDLPRLQRWLAWWHALPAALRTPVVRRFREGDTRRRKLADFLAYARTPHEVSSLQRRVFSESSRRALLSPDVLLALGDTRPFHPALAQLAAEIDPGDLFAVASGWELRSYMADVLLRDSDVMSMRHSLELRVPLVDRPLIEWLWRQPAAFKSDPRQPKSALAAALADVLPPSLAHRRKWGFTLPFAIWMKRELRPFLEDTFADASVARSGLFAPAAVQQLWHGFLGGRDTREWSRVWSLAVMIQFANRKNSAAPTAPRLAARRCCSRRKSSPRRAAFPGSCSFICGRSARPPRDRTASASSP